MICFIINYYNESASELQSLVDSIGTYYEADTQTFILGDGVKVPNIIGATSVMLPERLKQREHGGEWTHRYLAFYVMNSSAEYLIKIDPDTRVLGKIQSLPTSDCLFARINKYTIGKESFQFPIGGALGFTRGLAEMIVNKGYFLDGYYANKARFHDSQDRILEDIITKYGISCEHRLDFSTWSNGHDANAVFFHPRKRP